MMAGYNSFGPAVSDGIPISAGQKLQLRVSHQDGGSRQLARVRFGVHQLEPQSGGLQPGLVDPSQPPFVTGSWIAYGTSSGPVVLVGSTPQAVTFDPPLGAGWRPGGWAPDLTRIAFVHSDDGVAVYNVLTGAKQSGYDATPPAGGDSPNFSDVAWSHDGERLAVCHRGGEFPATVFGPDGQVEAGWPAYDSGGSPNGRKLAWSPNDERLAIMRLQGQPIEVWNTGTKQAESGWSSGSTSPSGRSVAWSPDGRFLAYGLSTSTTTRVELVDIADDRRRYLLRPFANVTTSGPDALAFSPDSTRLLRAGQGDQSFRMYDLTVDLAAVAEDDVIAEADIVESGWTRPSGVANAISWWWDGSRVAVSTNSTTAGLVVFDVASKTQEEGWPEVNAGSGVRFAYDPGNTTGG